MTEYVYETIVVTAKEWKENNPEQRRALIKEKVVIALDLLNERCNDAWKENANPPG